MGSLGWVLTFSEKIFKIALWRHRKIKFFKKKFFLKKIFFKNPKIENRLVPPLKMIETHFLSYDTFALCVYVLILNLKRLTNSDMDVSWQGIIIPIKFRKHHFQFKDVDQNNKDVNNCSYCPFSGRPQQFSSWVNHFKYW